MSKKNKNIWKNYDRNMCYECTGYGDNYSIDDNGELVSNCDNCPFNPMKKHDDSSVVRIGDD